MKTIGKIAKLLILVNLTFVASESSDRCNINGQTWYKYNGFCYSFSKGQNSKMSYYNAEDYCRSFGAHLVSIHSEEENEFILEKMEEGYGGRAWIGLNLFDGENAPKWSDGSNVTYQKVVKKEYPKKEKCFMMYHYQRGWRPEHCALNYVAICKIKDGVEPTALPPPPTLLPPTGYCPTEWIQFGQKCYKYFGAESKDRLNYIEARNACWNLGKEYSLVSIHSTDEQGFLAQHLADLGTSAWIGINKVESDEIGHDIVFGWVDNSRNNFEYWATGHPPPGTWKYCGRLAYDGMNKGEWIADYCEPRKQGYICQRQSDPNLPKPTPEPSKCKDGFEEYRDSCYKFISEPQTQAKAEETCVNLGGHLASITDSFEQIFLTNLVKNELNVRIGLENVQGTRYFQWTDKQPLYFTNWAINEPGPESNKSCAAMAHILDYKWIVGDCSILLPYICKISTAPTVHYPVILGTCPSWETDYIDIGDEYCYHYPMSMTKPILSWDTTLRYCLSKGMKMTSIHSDHQTKSLIAYMWRQSYPIHLGLFRTIDKQSYMWVDGSSLNYTNWADREPDTWQGDNKDCVAFSPLDGKWSIINCSGAGVAFCRVEKKLKRATNI